MTEVMVGGAILAGVVLAGARMFKDQKTAQKKVEHETALASYHSSLVKIMHNATHCNATLSAFADRSGASAWTGLTTIQTCNTCTSTSMAYTAEALKTLPKETLVTAGSTWTDGTKTWLVESFQIGASHTTMGVGPQATGKAILRVTYRLNPNIKGGGRRVSKDINLNLRFSQESPSKFKECLSGGASSVNNLAHDICETMTQVSSTGTIMRWDDATQSCKVEGSFQEKLKECPAGMIVEGIRSDGSVRCKSISAGVNPNQDLMQESAACPPGSKVKLEIVNGKVVSKCI